MSVADACAAIPRETVLACVVGAGVDLERIRSGCSFGGAIAWSDGEDGLGVAAQVVCVFTRWDAGALDPFVRVLKCCDADAREVLPIVIHHPGEEVPERPDGRRVIRWPTPWSLERALRAFASAVIAPVLFPGWIGVDIVDLLALLSHAGTMRLATASGASATQVADRLLRNICKSPHRGQSTGAFASLRVPRPADPISSIEAFSQSIDAAMSGGHTLVLAATPHRSRRFAASLLTATDAGMGLLRRQ